MLQLPIIGLFLRAIPEGILGIYAVYVFSGKKSDWKKTILSGLIFGIVTYSIRFLPINFGVHTVLGLIVYILLTTQINKVNIISAITSCIIFIIILFVSEAVTVPLMPKITGKSVEEVLNNPTQLVICGIPSLILTFIIVNVVYFTKNKIHDSKRSVK